MIEGNFGYKSNDDEIQNFIPKITVMGVGGAGCNAVNNMISQGIDSVDFIVANTDAQSLIQSKSEKKIQLGKQTTKGFGAGSRPEVGQKAAEESSGEISDVIKNTNILFLTAGMGGGTGSGAMPVIAGLAREKGILTVAIITTPFEFEGKKKEKIANDAIAKLVPNVDSYIVLPNQNLYHVAGKQMTFLNAFKVSDNVLYEGVKNITDLIRIPGTINLDFADIRAVMENSGRTLIGTSVQSGEDRAIKAVSGVLQNPMLSGNDIRGARSVLVNITANPENLSLDEPAEVMNSIRREIDGDETNFYLGTCFDANMGENLKVAIIATGLSEAVAGSSVFTSKPLNKDFMASISSEKKVEEKIEEKPLPINNETFEKESNIDSLGANELVLDNEKTEPESLFKQEEKVDDNSFDAFMKRNESLSIDDFINREAEEITKKSQAENLKKDDDNGDDDPTDPDGGNGKKKSPLSSFFDMLGESKEDNFFDDVETFGDDSKLSKSEDLEVKAKEKSEKHEDDNGVFLAGGLEEQKQEAQQTDIMEMLQKMEETMHIPAIFKKDNSNK
ncbi:MAG: cell division protein FtsZ [Alphaproteobacteria bacterium]|nr:cell division protein FtsZ [Alphaproteobacteria bacterium]